jgi:hypothetical protein
MNGLIYFRCESKLNHSYIFIYISYIIHYFNLCTKLIKQLVLTPIIAINTFKSDSNEEIELVKDFAKTKNVCVAVANIHAKGG